MKYLISILAILISYVSSTYVQADESEICTGATGLDLQILGSGGPIADDGRASTSYLLWVDGHSRFLIDSGGGAFLRFGEAGAQFEDLRHIAISHLHTDHSTDLVALLKSGFFSDRKAALTISGPAGSGRYPGLNQYLDRLLGYDKGAYAYLSGYLDGSDGLVHLDSTEVNPQTRRATRVYSNQATDMDIDALGVPHGPVPALAYKVRLGEHVVVFAGDQNGSSDEFIKFARGADILLMHMPVAQGVASNLHASPAIIGNIATQTNAKKLVLSHFMARSLENFKENLEEIHKRYPGPVVIAHDLKCIEI